MAELLTVLVAEDDPAMREFLCGILRTTHIAHMSIRVTAVSDGTQVISAYRSGGIDLCFLDIELAGKDGLNALREVHSFRPDAYIVIVSGHSTADNVRTALGAGAKGFVVKPFKTERIVQVIEQFLKHRYPQLQLQHKADTD